MTNEIGPALRAVAQSLASRPPVTGGRAAGTRPIILVHGFAVASVVMIPLERYLRRTLGRPVVRLDLGRRLPIHLQDIRASAEVVQREVERLAEAAGFEYVDVVGHSLGGLVAAYLLKRLDRGRRVRRVVTLGTPHRGTPLALLGVLLFGLVSRAVWQMLPGSRLLREIEEEAVPDGSDIVAVCGYDDAIVPHTFARVTDKARQLNRMIFDAGGHTELVTATPVLGLVGRLLS